MPRRFAVLITRHAISPRFAIRILSKSFPSAAAEDEKEEEEEQEEEEEHAMRAWLLLAFFICLPEKRTESFDMVMPAFLRAIVSKDLDIFPISTEMEYERYVCSNLL